MDNVNSNYKKNIIAFWKFVNGSVKSSAKNKIETFADDSGNTFLDMQVRPISKITL